MFNAYAVAYKYFFKFKHCGVGNLSKLMFIRTITNPRPEGTRTDGSFFFKCKHPHTFLLFNLPRKTKSMPDKFTTKTVAGGSKYENLF